ncbi:hypothetical protein [Paraferrimonas sp. SM1919]|uniref:DUF6942 family protein n=1 Tax=Paraferrimonas sp. SM1919 TaxID=2662263 RepID=UPI0013D096FA|nr:hypothetical protein [Paraferrimonas sp. SM1919]
MSQLGPVHAPICFYLPSKPIGHYEGLSQPLLSEQLIQNGGNHWRKILTIAAKLCAPNENWKDYRDNFLFTSNEQMRFASEKLTNAASLHFVCGQQSYQKLNIRQTPNKTSSPKVHYLANVIVLPYLDYRQFPNKDIEIARKMIQNFNI